MVSELANPLYTDELTAIRTSSIQVWIDEDEYTSLVDITAAELRIIGVTLTEGVHTLTVSVNDAAEPFPNNSMDSITFTIDATPPDIIIDRPTEGITITLLSDLVFEVSYSDVSSGINPDSLEVQLNNINLTSVFTKTTTSAAYYPKWKTEAEMDKYNLIRQTLNDGLNELKVSIFDNADNTTENIRHFNVSLDALDRSFYFRDQPIARRLISE